jgi:hypothetical protein
MLNRESPMDTGISDANELMELKPPSAKSRGCFYFAPVSYYSESLGSNQPGPVCTASGTLNAYP